MEDKKIEIIEYENKEYMVLYEKDNLVYTSNTKDKKDIKIFRYYPETDELSELDDEEYDEALCKFANEKRF